MEVNNYSLTIFGMYMYIYILVCMNMHSLYRVATPVIPVDWERECQVSSDNGSNINGGIYIYIKNTSNIV